MNISKLLSRLAIALGLSLAVAGCGRNYAGVYTGKESLSGTSGSLTSANITLTVTQDSGDTITGDWQAHKGLAAPEQGVLTAAPRPDRKAVFEAAAKESLNDATTEKPAKKAAAKKAAPAKKAATKRAPAKKAPAKKATARRGRR